MLSLSSQGVVKNCKKYEGKILYGFIHLKSGSDLCLPRPISERRTKVQGTSNQRITFIPIMLQCENFINLDNNSDPQSLAVMVSEWKVFPRRSLCAPRMHALSPCSFVLSCHLLQSPIPIFFIPLFDHVAMWLFLLLNTQQHFLELCFCESKASSTKIELD